MKICKNEDLKKDGYEIDNARIKSVDLSMADHGVLCLSMELEGDGWGCVYGGRYLGRGYLGCEYDYVSGSKKAIESIIHIMNVVGVEKFNDMSGKVIRVAIKRHNGGIIDIIGNVLEDKWFDIRSFFEEED